MVDFLKATDEKNRIRIRSSVVRICGSECVPKHHGSTTLIAADVTFFCQICFYLALDGESVLIHVELTFCLLFA
jgi:hypothetical protein